jgi:hypothetical protein
LILRHLRNHTPSSSEDRVKALELLHVACMAHIRRGVFEARADAPLAVDLLLAAIQKLYRIESRAKAMGLSLEARLQLRQREAKPIFMDVGQLIVALHAFPWRLEADVSLLKG